MGYKSEAGATVLLQPPQPGTLGSYGAFSKFSLTKQGPKNSGLPWLKGRAPQAPGVSLGQGLTLMSPGPRGSISCFSRTGKASAARTTSWWRIWGGTHRLCRSDLTTGLSQPRLGLLFP